MNRKKKIEIPFDMVLWAKTEDKPFTISKYGRAKYKLLDPFGFDYIGEYVTLSDAKQTSGNNYKME